MRISDSDAPVMSEKSTVIDHALFKLIPLVVIAMAINLATAQQPDRPNVIVMMADDLGYHDLSCYGSRAIRTPQLDQLARTGIRLTSFYSGGTVCTPSRMALMTGAYPTRVGWRGGVIGYKIEGSQGLSPSATTMAEIFKSAGYATGICGKWHLGDTASLLPMNQGFDQSFYIKRSNNQTKQLWRNDSLVADPFDNRRLTERFTEAAIEFINTNQSRPFFLYIPFTAPHFPAEPHPQWKGKSARQAYGDVVEELDSRIGEILAALKSASIDDQTVVVFLSDNGPEPGQKKWASAKPYRGLKWSSLEGGTRVPCIVSWPGVIPGGQESNQLIAAIDLLPTLAHACNIELPDRHTATPKIDGVNVWRTLIGEAGAKHPRKHLLYWNGWADLQAIRVGEWKLYMKKVPGIEPSSEGYFLVQLEQDPEERTNLSAAYPDRVQSMKSLASRLIADIEANQIASGETNAR